jgi:hypothetical protein
LNIDESKKLARTVEIPGRKDTFREVEVAFLSSIDHLRFGIQALVNFDEFAKNKRESSPTSVPQASECRGDCDRRSGKLDSTGGLRTPTALSSTHEDATNGSCPHDRARDQL